MYAAMPGSPVTWTDASITATQTTIPVANISVFPSAPNTATIVDAFRMVSETVRYNGISGNTLTGCTRGFGGTTARSWEVGRLIARRITARDHEAFITNIVALRKSLNAIEVTNKSSNSVTDEGHTHAIKSSSLAGKGLIGSDENTLAIGTPMTLTATTQNDVTDESHSHSVEGFITPEQLKAALNGLGNGLDTGNSSGMTASFIGNNLTFT